MTPHQIHTKKTPINCLRSPITALPLPTLTQPLNPRITKHILILILTAVLSSPILAADNAANLPIDLSADHGEYNGNTGTATYSGHVVISQGDMKLTGDKVTIHTADGKVTRIEAWGNLATFHYKPNNEPAVDGKGKHMTYNVPAASVNISGNASVRQADNTTRGDSLTYNLDSEIVTGKRVKMTFLPATS